MLTKRKSVFHRYVISGVILFSLQAACGQSGPQKITILHTNDMHGAYLPTPASWLPEKPMIGGFAALDYYIDRERERAGLSLLLDAGDLMTGTLICDMEYQGASGGALVAMMNRIGYDGWVFGNHEFDKGAANLRGLIKIARFPVFCANLARGDTLFVPDAYHIYKLNGLKVGVIGLTYHRMVGMASPEKLDGFISLDPAPVVSDIVAEIDPQTDLIIVLSHLGIENDRQLAESVKGVDLILGGHSHSRLETPERINGVIIAQTGSNSRNLGRLDLVVAGDSISEYSGQLIPLLTADITPDSGLSAMIDSIKTEIDKTYAVVIAELKSDWETQYRAESNIGNWLTDALRRRMNTEVAFLNSGGIRKNLPAGPVTKMDIHEILPFDNKVVTFLLTGEELIKIAEHNVGLEQGSYQGSLQISGLSYCWTGDSANIKLTDVRIGGQPIVPDKRYSVASIDYVANANADRYFGFVPESSIAPTGLGLTELMLEAVEKAGVIESKIDGRTRRLADQ
jgi:2',3'-cyclic-nucleotide 2'-phosphodiesterase (5'-nucleotidase family)